MGFGCLADYGIFSYLTLFLVHIFVTVMFYIVLQCGTLCTSIVVSFCVLYCVTLPYSSMVCDMAYHIVLHGIPWVTVWVLPSIVLLLLLLLLLSFSSVLRYITLQFRGVWYGMHQVRGHGDWQNGVVEYRVTPEGNLIITGTGTRWVCANVCVILCA